MSDRSECQPADGPGNLIDVLHRLVTSDAAIDRNQIRVRDSQQSFVDATVFSGSRDRAQMIIEPLNECPITASARQKGPKITLRLSDEFVIALGERLELGHGAGLEVEDLLAGKRYFVDYADPNVTKALHVGHLRCLVVGHGFASALRCAGGDVSVLSLVNDMGRSICEAMAGYVQFHDGETPESAGLKSDVFVGRCYAEYVRSLQDAFAHESSEHGTIGRELEDRRDLADTILNRWIEEDPGTVELWKRVRDWVLQGHDETFDRLKICIDRPLYESKALNRAKLLADDGLLRGLFDRDMSGGLFYETGRSEYKRIPLVRFDGVPTENLRLAAIWYDLQNEGVGLEACLHVMGDEWVLPITCREQMLADLIPCPLYERYHKIGYGMVTLNGLKMKSSDGESVLIDDFLDRLKGLEQVRQLASASDEQVTVESLAKIIAFGSFLNEKLSKPIEFSWEQVISEKRNPGWSLARAWSKVHQDGSEEVCDPDPADTDYRFAVLQSQNLRERLREVVTQYDLSRLARYLIFLSTWYASATNTSSRCSRVMRNTLQVGFSSLGLI